jgi:hypothetical protein
VPVPLTDEEAKSIALQVRVCPESDRMKIWRYLEDLICLGCGADGSDPDCACIATTAAPLMIVRNTKNVEEP